MTKLLAVDPGSLFLGWAFFKDGTLGDWGAFAQKKSTEKVARINAASSFVEHLIRDLSPSILVLEEYYAFARMRGSDVVPALRGGIMIASARAKIKYEEVSPTQVKKTITGKGNCGKDLVKAAVLAQYKIDAALPDDVFDAIAIGTTYLKLQGE